RRHLKLQRAYGAFWRTLFAQAVEAGAIRADLDLAVVRMPGLRALKWSGEWLRGGPRSGGRPLAGPRGAQLVGRVVPRRATVGRRDRGPRVDHDPGRARSYAGCSRTRA